MNNIKYLLFDLGGVLLHIDYAASENAFAQLQIAEYKTLFKQHYSSDLFKQLEVGEIDDETFYDSFRTATQSSVTNAQIQQAWNAMLGNFIEPNIQYIKELSRKYRIYLYSNTNAIHYTAFKQKYQQQFATITDFDQLFTTAYYSHIFHYRKPDTESFLRLLKAEQLPADQTLFIDDTLINIDGATQAGIPTLLLTDAWQLPQLLSQKLSK